MSVLFVLLENGVVEGGLWVAGGKSEVSKENRQSVGRLGSR